MLYRKLEPEVMDSIEEAIDYNQMDHSQVNRLFSQDFLNAIKKGALSPQSPLQVFDAGTGTALIPIEIIKSGLPAVITASDLSEQMLNVAAQNLEKLGFQSAIKLALRDCKRLADDDQSYDAVISNSIIHHIPDPEQVLRELWRILKTGGMLFVRDLMRPAQQAHLEHLVQVYAGDANPHQQQMFRDSLHAALTVDEVKQLLTRVGIPPEAVRPTSDRHWTITCFK